jgi:hypothetical protein
VEAFAPGRIRGTDEGRIMKLTTEQQQSVAAWVAAGATLNEIQDRLKTELGLVMTFMDTRFLLADLGLSLQEPDSEAAEPEASAEVPAETGDDAEGEYPGDFPEAPEELPAPGAQVRVTVDAVTLPGTMVSGKVTFSDGVKGGWYLDQMGQLGLTGIDRGYQPPEADVVAFQRELQRALR